MYKRTSIYYALSLLLSLFTILQVYYINVGGIFLSLASVILLALLPLCIISINLSNIKLDYNTFALLVFLFIHFLLFSVSNNISNEIIMSTINYLLVLFVLSIIVPNIYDSKLGIQMFISISIVSSVFLILQFVFLHVFNIYISGQFSILDYRTSVMGHVRPFSFFSEPSSFGFYNSLGLAMVLYSDWMNMKKKMILSIIITFALFLSLSTTSIGLLILVWTKWGIARLKLTEVKFSVIFMLFLILPLFLLLGWYLNIFNTIYEHSIAGLYSGNYAAGLTGRIGNLSYAWEFHRMPISKIFGAGMVNLDYFIPAFARIYIYYGIFGYVLLAIFFTRIYIISNEYCRTFILIAIVAAIFSDSIFGVQMLLYMPLVISNKNIIRRKN